MKLVETLGIVSMVLVAWFTMRAYRDDRAGAGRQTRREAIIEIWIGIFIGFGLNWSMNWLLLPMVGARFTAMENFWLGMIYTLVSILRGYAIRRWADVHIHMFSRWLSSRISR